MQMTEMSNDYFFDVWGFVNLFWVEESFFNKGIRISSKKTQWSFLC